MKPKRQLELDLMKVLIIPLMIFGHVLETVFSHEWEDMLYCDMTSVWQLLLIGMNIFGAFGFMFSMGATIPFSRNQDPEVKIKRGLDLILKWFVLNLCIMVPLGIRFAKNYGMTFWQFYIRHIFSSDILCFAGLFFVFYGLHSRCKWFRVPLFAGISVCLFGLGHLISYKGDVFILQVILGNFVISEKSVFSFLNWIMAPTLGLCWGKLLQKTKNQDRLYAILGISGAAVLTAVFLSLKHKGMLTPENLTRWMDVKVFYQVKLDKLVLSFCAMAVVLSFCYLITRIFRSERFQSIYTGISGNLNILYILQWVIIPWLAVFIPEPTQKYSPWWAVLLAAVVYAAALLLSPLVKKLMVKPQETPAAPTTSPNIPV